MPVPLFPFKRAPANALDMIPIVADPTGRGARAWEILRRILLSEGRHAGKRIGENAPPWQKPLTKLIFGHTDEHGLRLLRDVFVLMAKKNAKTGYAAALALTKLLLNEEQRELVVCLAANRAQARLAFDYMANAVRADRKLLDLFDVVEHRHVIKYLPTNSIARAVSAELASVVGLNPSMALVDELHLLGATPKGQKLIAQARTGSVARREPLIVSISTMPVDRSGGVFESTLAKARRVISGEEVDPRFFAWLCEMPQSLDPENPQNWHWANPSLGFTVELDRLKSDFESAKSDPSALRDFRSQNLNISPEDSAGAGRWLSLKEWDSCADATITLDALLDEAAFIYLGTDAGGLDDLSACVFLGKRADGTLLVWSHQWLSRRGYEKRAATNDYDRFIAAGELTIFDGGAADIHAIAELAEQVAAGGKLRMIGIDSYGAPELEEALGRCDCEIRAVPQSWKQTASISWLERRIADKAFRHNGSSLLRWNVGNAVATRHGNAVSISKATVVGAGKIDGVAALLNAVGVCVAAEDEVSIYDTAERAGGFLVV